MIEVKKIGITETPTGGLAKEVHRITLTPEHSPALRRKGSETPRTSEVRRAPGETPTGGE